jgi:hypothetical protein
MTDFADFTAQIADWANREDWSPSLVASYVRMAEQKLNAELRISRMIQFNDGLIASCCAPLPADWLEFLNDGGVQIASTSAPEGFWPLRYKPVDEFMKFRPDWTYDWLGSQGFYTIQGRQIFFGGTPDAVNGLTYRIVYFGEVPVFSDDTDSWVYDKYPSLYLYAALMHAGLHAVGEEQGAMGFKALAEDTINKLNAEYQRGKASGSRLSRSRIRSFG